MSETHDGVGIGVGMGWMPDYPDLRDYDIGTKEIAPKHIGLGHKPINEMLEALNMTEPPKGTAPPKIDLIDDCPEIEDQGALGSCTANAGVGMIEYYEKRAYEKYIDASRLFLYKVTRNLLNWTGDTGAYLRTTMGAMALFGVPPEKYWRYIIADFDVEPSAFCYAFAQNYQAIQYFRLDPFGTSRDELLARIKLYIRAHLPSMFGFTVYSSYTQASDDGKIPFPCARERVVGGHAVMAVGYNDECEIRNTHCGTTTTGALIIRNSWGKNWGEEGYGYLPYDYVKYGLAIDWWTLLKNEYVNTRRFGF